MLFHEFSQDNWGISIEVTLFCLTLLLVWLRRYWIIIYIQLQCKGRTRFRVTFHTKSESLLGTVVLSQGQCCCLVLRADYTEYLLLWFYSETTCCTSRYYTTNDKEYFLSRPSQFISQYCAISSQILTETIH